mmetsp:Transcript_32779/g.99059  ORF Transcript_32779/g.99059 Transcript_32779/m.99059 type:complete len:336 (+) Transcript_32779:272-1279(+)
MLRRPESRPQPHRQRRQRLHRRVRQRRCPVRTPQPVLPSCRRRLRRPTRRRPQRRRPRLRPPRRRRSPHSRQPRCPPSCRQQLHLPRWPRRRWPQPRCSRCLPLLRTWRSGARASPKTRATAQRSSVCLQKSARRRCVTAGEGALRTRPDQTRSAPFSSRPLRRPPTLLEWAVASSRLCPRLRPHPPRCSLPRWPRRRTRRSPRQRTRRQSLQPPHRHPRQPQRRPQRQRHRRRLQLPSRPPRRYHPPLQQPRRQPPRRWCLRLPRRPHSAPHTHSAPTRPRSAPRRSSSAARVRPSRRAHPGWTGRAESGAPMVLPWRTTVSAAPRRCLLDALP